MQTIIVWLLQTADSCFSPLVRYDIIEFCERIQTVADVSPECLKFVDSVVVDWYVDHKQLIAPGLILFVFLYRYKAQWRERYNNGRPHGH